MRTKALEMTKTSKKGVVGATSKAFVKWTEKMDDVFIHALLNQQRLGNRPDGVFTSIAYSNIVKELSEKLHISIEKDHLKNRIKTLKTNFNVCYELFKGLSGFSWSPITRMFDADPEVWNALIELKPEAKKWMMTPINHYDKLFELFARNRATSKAAERAKERFATSKAAERAKVKSFRRAQEQGIRQFDNIEHVDQIVLDNEVILENLDFTTPMDDPVTHSEARSAAPSQSAASQTINSTKGKKRKIEMTDLFDKQNKIFEIGMEKLSSAIREGNDAIREGNVIIERGRARVYSEDEVYAALVELDIDETLLMDAYVFLIENEKRVRAFFGCPPKGRKQLLTRMMKS